MGGGRHGEYFEGGGGYSALQALAVGPLTKQDHQQATFGARGGGGKGEPRGRVGGGEAGGALGG